MFTRTKLYSVVAGCALATVLAGCIPPNDLTHIEDVGHDIYFDTSLSEPGGQSCASCHLPTAGFADPDQGEPTSRGIFVDRFGNRNTPTAAYASFIPARTFDTTSGTYSGGLFVDGRAASLEEQAKGPFLNPVEMANPDKATVVNKVRNASYAKKFEQVFGSNVWDDVDTAYNRIAEAIAAFERTRAFSPFSAKYDAFLAGKVKLSAAEQRGLDLFEGKARCAACHPSQASDDGTPPLFTDFSYDNLGVPANPANPFYTVSATFNPAGTSFKDLGLGGSVNESAQNGKFRVPTLRNIAHTAPYFHNGVFSTLEQVVQFYNTRDTATPPIAPEVSENVNSTELGNLGLSQSEESDLVAFLKTLSDGYYKP